VLGMNGRLERKLRQHGKAAMATVLSIHRKAWTMYMIPDTDVNPGAAGQEPKALWKIAARVEPDGEPVFDAKIGVWLGVHSRPSQGWIIPVLYDPSDDPKVAFDRSRLAQEAANRANRARLVAAASQQGAETPMEQLTKLMDLYERGLLTDAEYEAQKQRLLGR
jgi:Short C-terminal domain